MPDQQADEEPQTQGRQELLISLAMLRHNRDRNQEFLDSFVPFVADCLRRAGRQGLDDVGLARDVHERFGIRIPVSALKTILKRMRRAGLAEVSSSVHTATEATLDLDPLGPARDQEERKVRALSSNLRQFVLREHGVAWDEAESDDALQYFVENWTASLNLMRSRIDGEPFEPPLIHQRETDYLVASFVLHLRQFEPEPFEWFIDVIKGSMLSVGLYLDPGRIRQSLESVTAYLDTPLLLDLLVGSEDTRAGAQELLDIASELDMQVACFEHTVAETRGVLDYRAASIRRIGGSREVDPEPTQISDEFSPSDLEDLSSQLPAVLASRGVDVRRKPVWDGTDTVDEAQLEEVLQQDVGYRNRRARDRDVESLVAVHRIRRAGSPLRIEDAKAIFVTTNDDLVRASGRHFGTHGDPLSVPVAMTSHELATLLWLKSPTPRPDLPWKQVIADCRAAINPNDAVWSRYLDEVAALEQREDVDPEMYYVARFSNEARAALMGMTHGDPDRVNSSTVAEILQQARDELSSPIRAELQDARQARAAAAEELERERAARARAEESNVALAERVDGLEQAETERKRKAERRQRAARVVVAAVSGLLIFVGLSIFAWVLPVLEETRHQVGVTIGALIVGASTVYAIAKKEHRTGALGVLVAAAFFTASGVFFL